MVLPHRPNCWPLKRRMATYKGNPHAEGLAAPAAPSRYASGPYGGRVAPPGEVSTCLGEKLQISSFSAPALGCLSMAEKLSAPSPAVFGPSSFAEL